MKMFNISFNISFINAGNLSQSVEESPKNESNEVIDKLINDKINECRDDAIFNSTKSLKNLKNIKQNNFSQIHDKTKYRLLVNIAVAYEIQNKKEEAVKYFIKSKEHSNDCSAFYYAIYGYLVL